ncbi:MAG: glutamyl-tRNA reductase [Bacteroidota bacterium]
MGRNTSALPKNAGRHPYYGYRHFSRFSNYSFAPDGPEILVAGLSYKRSDVDHRSRFAFNHDECAAAYKNYGGNFFILSTCNRTEVYGFTANEDNIKAILLEKANCTPGELQSLIYVKEDNNAVSHFFRVAAGLDSQIPGDYEIISQIKSAFTLAKEHSKTNGFMEKIFNYALQASKEIKNKTSFSDGTISVAYSVALQLAKSEAKKVTVLGAGETGELVIKYLQKLRPEIQIHLVNRDKTRLQLVAGEYDVVPFPIAMLSEAIFDSDALVVTTNATMPLVDMEHVEGSQLKMVFDLSVPRNIHHSIYEIMHVMDVDDVSKQINVTIENRLREVPKVESIIFEHIEEFNEWTLRRALFHTEK